MERAEGETLMQLLARTGSRVTLRGANGHAIGITAAPVEKTEVMRLLASTLVGDTFLAFEHLKKDPTSPEVLKELGKQLVVYRKKCVEETGQEEDLDAFLDAIEAWVPGKLPRGAQLIARLEEARYA